MKAVTEMSEKIGFSADKIFKYLHDDIDRNRIFVYDTVESTNITARALSESGINHTAVISNSQTCGRGRMGRNFFSPPESGLYISFIIAANAFPFPISMVTPWAAVTVSEAVRDITGLSLSIKWVNDLFSCGKKVCGILTETVAGAGDIIIGIGINIDTNVFPEDISSIAGSLFSQPADTNTKNRLAAALIKKFLCGSFPQNEIILSEYRKRLNMLNKTVAVTGYGTVFTATALDVDSMGHLIVKKPDGEIIALPSGEISVRPEDESGEI